MNIEYDFKDGNGPVPAKRHENGGGWVASSANVSDTTYIGPNARVFGNARVSGYAVVSDGALTGGAHD